MKLLTVRSVYHLERPGHDLWKETFLLSFSNVFFGEYHKLLPSERGQISLQPISPELSNSQFRWINSAAGQRKSMYFDFG